MPTRCIAIADVPFQIQHRTEQGCRITLGIDGDGIGGPEDTPGGNGFFIPSGDSCGGTTLQLKEHILCWPRARSPNIDGGDVGVFRATVLVGTVIEGLPFGPVGVSEENNKQQNEGLFHENLGFGVVRFKSVSNGK